MNIKSQVPNSNYTTQTEGGLPVVDADKFYILSIIMLKISNRVVSLIVSAAGVVQASRVVIRRTWSRV